MLFTNLNYINSFFQDCVACLHRPPSSPVGHIPFLRDKRRASEAGVTGGTLLFHLLRLRFLHQASGH